MIAAEMKNYFLNSLAPSDWDLLKDRLEAVELPVRYDLAPRHRRVTHVYFLEHGMASVVARSPRGHQAEIALIGNEGWVGLSIALGVRRAPNHTFMQIGGAGYRMEADAFEAALEQSPTLRARALSFVYAFLVQTSQTVLANAHGKLEERLARWLLMAHDRAHDEALPLTHEFLSHMLGVRRAGVSVALRALIAQGVVSGRRGSIEIEDREALEKVANGFYGVPESEMRRLLDDTCIAPDERGVSGWR